MPSGCGHSELRGIPVFPSAAPPRTCASRPPASSGQGRAPADVSRARARCANRGRHKLDRRRGRGAVRVGRPCGASRYASSAGQLAPERSANDVDRSALRDEALDLMERSRSYSRVAERVRKAVENAHELRWRRAPVALGNPQLIEDAGQLQPRLRYSYRSKRSSGGTGRARPERDAHTPPRSPQRLRPHRSVDRASRCRQRQADRGRCARRGLPRGWAALMQRTRRSCRALCSSVVRERALHREEEQIRGAQQIDGFTVR